MRYSDGEKSWTVCALERRAVHRHFKNDCADAGILKEVEVCCKPRCKRPGIVPGPWIPV